MALAASLCCAGILVQAAAGGAGRPVSRGGIMLGDRAAADGDTPHVK